MQAKGYVLLVLLIMLLFAATVLVQLNENNYLAHLVSRHLDALSSARAALASSFNELKKVSEEQESCYFDENDQNELQNFWASNAVLCQIITAGMPVNYVFRDFQQDEQVKRYRQYTLRVKTLFSYIWLRVIIEQPSGIITFWSYQVY